MVSIVGSEVATTVGRAKVQDWQPETPSRQSSGTLSAWTEQLLAGFKVGLLSRTASVLSSSCFRRSLRSYSGLPLSQEVFAVLLSMLPPDSAEHVIRAVLSFTCSAILALFVEDDGITEYNIFALFRLHGDISGLARFAKTFASMPGLEVRAQSVVHMLTTRKCLHRDRPLQERSLDSLPRRLSCRSHCRSASCLCWGTWMMLRSLQSGRRCSQHSTRSAWRWR